MTELLEEDKEMIIEILQAYCFFATNRFFGSYNPATPEASLLKLYKAYEKVPRINEIIKILKGEK